MRLISFSVEKYRSITKAHKIHVGNKTILIGPNNEGKSNILRALAAAMHILTRSVARPIGRRLVSPRSKFIASRRFYNWSQDFPLHLQEKNPQGKTSVILEFQLTDDELAEFRSKMKSNLNGTLPLKLSIGQRSLEVRVAKRGSGAATLSKKSNSIARFVVSKLDFEHIPAVRTATSAQTVVDSLVERELWQLEEDVAYYRFLQPGQEEQGIKNKGQAELPARYGVQNAGDADQEKEGHEQGHGRMQGRAAEA